MTHLRNLAVDLISSMPARVQTKGAQSGLPLGVGDQKSATLTMTVDCESGQPCAGGKVHDCRVIKALSEHSQTRC